MSTGKSKPPFKRGEWVFTTSGRHTGAVLGQVRSCYFVGTPGMGCYWVRTANSDDYASWCRPATARELRAESKRLAKRAAKLATAADAVESKPRKNRK